MEISEGDRRAIKRNGGSLLKFFHRSYAQTKQYFIATNKNFADFIKTSAESVIDCICPHISKRRQVFK